MTVSIVSRVWILVRSPQAQESRVSYTVFVIYMVIRYRVFVMQEGNYHGTDFFEQRLRGMWEWMFTNLIVEYTKPNDIDNLCEVFRKYENSTKEK